MSVTDDVLVHMLAGRPLNAWSARQTFGVKDIRKLLWNIRIRGYHISETPVMSQNKHTGEPVTVIQYRMEETNGFGYDSTFQ